MNDAYVALTELVANAWDAGAYNVFITIPSDLDKELIVEDDGCGLTPQQFAKDGCDLDITELNTRTQSNFSE